MKRVFEFHYIDIWHSRYCIFTFKDCDVKAAQSNRMLNNATKIKLTN